MNPMQVAEALTAVMNQVVIELQKINEKLAWQNEQIWREQKEAEHDSRIDAETESK